MAGEEVIISADSHVMEPPDLWEKRLPAAFRDRAPRFPDRRNGEGFHPGGWDPSERLKEMAIDGVSAEVLYPTLGLRLFSLDDAALQVACCRIFNDWLIEYCQVAPDRLVGIAMISVYNVDQAIKELERCKKAGLRGALIWQVPPKELPFTSEHYDRFWAAAQELELPVNLHILTGHGYSKDPTAQRGIEHYRSAVNLKLAEAADALFYLIFSGVLERFPRLKLVLVENEIGWIPFVLNQWDKYFQRFRKTDPLPIEKRPSEYFQRQVAKRVFSAAGLCDVLQRSSGGLSSVAVGSG